MCVIRECGEISGMWCVYVLRVVHEGEFWYVVLECGEVVDI